MKIAVVTQYFPTPDQPWAGHSAYQTLCVLAQMHEVKVFYPQATDLPGIRPAGKRRKKTGSGPFVPRVTADYISYPVVPILSRSLNGWTASRALLPHIRQFSPDILLNYVVYPDGFAAVTIGRKLDIPVVLTAIGSDLNRISDPLCAALTRSALRHADFTITVSGHLLGVAHALGARPGKCKAILNGCDAALFHPRDKVAERQRLGIDLDAQVVLYAGRLDMRKGLSELVEAYAALKPSRPRLHCYIIGDGPDGPLLREQIARVAPGIEVRSACTTEVVASWMGAADLVALPSYKEGCPNVIVEALSSGRPVVATRVGGIPELMDDRTGRLVEPKNSIQLANAIAEVLDTVWHADALAARSARSWDRVAREVEEVLLQTLDQHHTSREKDLGVDSRAHSGASRKLQRS